MKIQIEINSQVIENASKLNFFLKKSYHFYDVVVLTETLQLPFFVMNNGQCTLFFTRDNNKMR